MMENEDRRNGWRREKEREREGICMFFFLGFFLALISKYRIGMGKPVAGRCQPSYLFFHRHLRILRERCRMSKESVMQRQREKRIGQSDWPMDQGLKCKSAKFFISFLFDLHFVSDRYILCNQICYVSY